MKINGSLYQAYWLKEDLRMFWNFPNVNWVQTFLASWIHQARTYGLKYFVKLADTLGKHLAGLLAYFKHRISTGPLEEVNNKIKVLKRQAHGFQDQAYFKLLLYFTHESAPAFAV